MKSSKYNVILMRDDTSVKNFRLSPAWIKFILTFFLVLLVTSVAGLYYAVALNQERHEIAKLYENKKESLEQVQRELARLQNIEKMFKSYNEQEIRSLLRAQEQEEPAPAGPPAGPEVDLVDIFHPVDMHIVGISNVQARFINSRMRVQLEVNNMKGEGTVSGRVFLFLIKVDGVTIDLGLDDRDLYYAIARFKKIDVTFGLPDGLTQDGIFALRIKAEDDEGEVLFSTTYPISNILT